MGCVADWRLFDPDAAKLNIDPDPPHYRNVARSMAMYGQTRRRLHSCLYVNSRLTWTCNSLYRNWLKQDTSVFHTALCDTYLYSTREQEKNGRKVEKTSISSGLRTEPVSMYRVPCMANILWLCWWRVAFLLIFRKRQASADSLPCVLGPDWRNQSDMS